MEICSSKLNWLIHIKKLFQKDSVLNITDLINQLKDETILDISNPQEELFSLDEVIEEVYKFKKKRLNYDDFFQIIGNLHQQDHQQSTCVNSLADSINDLSDTKVKQEIRISYNDPTKLIKTQQSYKVTRLSKSPRLKIENLQEAQKKLLAKITDIENEIEYQKQQHQLKKPHQLLIKELTKQLTQSSDEIILNGVQNFTLQDFYLVFHNLNKSIFNIKILTFQERSQEIREVAMIFKNLQALSINNFQIKTLKLEELIELKVLSVAGNQLKNLEGLPPNLIELYAQNNQIQQLSNTKSLKIFNISANNLSQLNQLTHINKSLEFINCNYNICANSKDYKRLLFKIFPNLKGVDKEDLLQHSTIQQPGFHYNKDIMDFSFSQS
ncbi:unnamed protein product [Paramecium pentaurelia]|uniref:Leucine rich repeat protein n=1 Tax=Paramecium pentaurelia TaxID=43138 RepID=A0A8S1T9N0_9CILI|nr:unnamed protein product [Paramecium pentaurelia]